MPSSERKLILVLAATAALIGGALPSAASAASTPPKVGVPDYPAGTKKLTYKVPLNIEPGQNLNLLKSIGKNTKMRPSLGFLLTLEFSQL